jgi:HEAT repeat protein
MSRWFSILSAGPWLKSHWWQSGAAVVVVGLSLWCLVGARSQVTGGTPEDRVASIDKVVTERAVGAVEAVAAAVRDKSSLVRETAIVALGEFNERADLVQAGLDDPAPGVRYAAAVTLGKMGGPRAADVLWAVALNGGMDVETRKGALRGLARVATPQAIVRIVRAMDVAEPEVARTAMEVLTCMMRIRWVVPPDPADKIEWARKMWNLKQSRFVQKAADAGGG